MDSKLQTHIFNLIVSHQCIPNKGCAYGFTRADIEFLSKEIVELIQPSGDVSILIKELKSIVDGYDHDSYAHKHNNLPACLVCSAEKALSSYQSSQPSEGKEEWISVEDGWPPKTDKFYYWLYSDKADSYNQGEYDHEEYVFINPDGERLYGITHWKVPKPPQSSIKTS